MSCFKTITKRAARAEVRPRPTPQWIRHEGVLYRQVAGDELRGAFKGLRAARTSGTQRKARARVQAAARGARQSRPQPVAKPAQAGAPAAPSASGEGSSSSDDEGGSGDDDGSSRSGEEPDLARLQRVLFAVGGAS